MYINVNVYLYTAAHAHMYKCTACKHRKARSSDGVSCQLVLGEAREAGCFPSPLCPQCPDFSLIVYTKGRTVAKSGKAFGIIIINYTIDISID